jgi:hypothetical protein
MADPMRSNLALLRQYWSGTLSGLVWGQWVLMDTGLRATQTVLQAASAFPASSPERPDPTEKLIHRARERMRLGLAPPREIYQAPYRDRIDWGEFPDWARPSDPDAFGGNPHEG